MRDAKIYLSPVFYKMFEGEQEILDAYGNPTGSYYPIYSELKSIMMSVSPNKGDSEATMYGTALDYSRTMSIADPDCEIDENTVLWLDGADTNEAWNYQVVAVSRSKNLTSYAIQLVDVSIATEQMKQMEAYKQMRNEV